MIKRQYYIACESCGGKTFSMAQDLEVEDENQWESVETNKMFSHAGFGWELEDFEMTCSNCQGHDFKVEHKKVTDE